MTTMLNPPPNSASKPVTWTIEYDKGVGDFDHYQQIAHTAEVTDGGVLLFSDAAGRVTTAVSPTGWTQVTAR